MCISVPLIFLLMKLQLLTVRTIFLHPPNLARSSLQWDTVKSRFYNAKLQPL